MKRRLIIPMTLLIWVAAPLWAQEPDDALTALRTRATFSDEDQALIREFVTQNVAAIVTNDPLAAQEALARLRQANAGSDGFKSAYVGVCLETVNSVLARADVLPAARLITLVNAFDTVDAQALLTSALGDQRVGVRAAAAVGLARLRAAIAQVGGGAYGQALDALLAAGKLEKSRGTLRAIYQAMNYASLPSPPDVKRNIAAVLELLEERARRYAAGAVDAVGADDAGLRVAGALLSSMDDAERKRVTVVVATMLKQAVEQYASGQRKLADVRDKGAAQESLARRNGMERLVEVGEGLLNTLLAPEGSAPSVAKSMRRLETIEMKNEWAKWVTLLQSAVGQDFALAETPADDDAGEPPDAGE